jgi:hypothetical protein
LRDSVGRLVYGLVKFLTHLFGGAFLFTGNQAEKGGKIEEEKCGGDFDGRVSRCKASLTFCRKRGALARAMLPTG